VGFTYDPEQFPQIDGWKEPSGAVMHVWRAQGWFVNMFEIESLDAASHSIEFGTTEGGWVKGGWQGGRGWQVDHSKINSTTENYLLAGGWMIDNVREEVDAPNEYYYDKAEHKLYLIPNKTMAAAGGVPDPAIQLVAGKLQTLISLTGQVSSQRASSPVQNVTIQGLHFRDAADTSMEPWGVPSGGDWGLYRGAAVFFEGTEGCSVTNCEFIRVDNNCLFVSGWNRRTTFADNHFAWLGLSAMAGCRRRARTQRTRCDHTQRGGAETRLTSRCAPQGAIPTKRTGWTGCSHGTQPSSATMSVRSGLSRSSPACGSKRRPASRPSTQTSPSISLGPP
jgi:hypothetical protein